jgi:hypothetical protein
MRLHYFTRVRVRPWPDPDPVTPDHNSGTRTQRFVDNRDFKGEIIDVIIRFGEMGERCRYVESCSGGGGEEEEENETREAKAEDKTDETAEAM